MSIFAFICSYQLLTFVNFFPVLVPVTHLVYFRLSLYFPGGWCGSVITRFKAKSAQLDLTSQLELSLTKVKTKMAKKTILFCL